MKIEELVKQLKKGEMLVYNKSLSWVAVTSNIDEQKTRRVFKMKDGELEEIPYKNIRKQLIKIIMEKINTDKFVELVLTESLDTTQPDSLFDMIERVIEREGTVKQRPGCVELEIGGKPGRHLHFQIM